MIIISPSVLSTDTTTPPGVIYAFFPLPIVDAKSQVHHLDGAEQVNPDLKPAKATTGSGGSINTLFSSHSSALSFSSDYTTTISKHSLGFPS